MFTRSIIRLTLASIIVVSALLLIASVTANAASPKIHAPDAVAVRYVATTGDDASNLCLDQQSPCSTVQHAIDVANDGDQVLIASGLYTQSATLSKPVSLTGVNSDTTILHAVAGQRVLTVTGATISNSVVISGLTFTGGDATGGQGADVYPPPPPGFYILPTPTRTPTPIPTLGSQSASLQWARRPERAADSPAARSLAWLMQQSPDDFAPTTDGLGGGLLITNSAQPQLQAVRLNNNLAGYGGGLYADGASSLRLSRIDASGNVAMAGGGLYANAPITLEQARLSNNTSLSTGGGAHVSGAITLLNSQVTHNAGGGLQVQGNLTAQQSDISFNSSNATNFSGGGVTQSAGQLILDDVTVEGNIPAGWGSAIFANGSNVKIANTRVLSNSGYPGSGLVLINGRSGQIVNSLFAHNVTSFVGYGASIYSWGDLQIIHTTIADTSLNPSAAIYFEVGSLHITNTVIANYTTGILTSQYNTGVTEDYNLFYGNTVDRNGVTPGAHSLNGDPMFVDPLNDDYHVMIDSAAIDAGVDAGIYTDLDGNVRPRGAGFDIGAYEFSNATRYVATTGDDASNLCLDQQLPCSTVQHAIDVANDGDQVLIASGLYTQSATLSKPVSLTGVNSDTTILHAVAGQRVLTVTGATISNSVVISGLTFTGGYAGFGGGIYSDAPVVMMNLKFISNVAQQSGGAAVLLATSIG